jgi:hypothetical protein
MYSYIPYSISRQVHSLLQSQSSTHRDPVRPLEIFLKLIKWLLTFSSSPSRHFFPSLSLSFSNVLQKAVPMQDVTDPVSLPSIYCCMYDIPLLLESM